MESQSYLDVPPELIIEIMSPDDRWSGVNDKLAEYFDIGVRMVWVVNPHRQQVHVYRSLTEIEILNADAQLSGGELLPGYQVSVAELFE